MANVVERLLGVSGDAAYCMFDAPYGEIIPGSSLPSAGEMDRAVGEPADARGDHPGPSLPRRGEAEPDFAARQQAERK